MNIKKYVGFVLLCACILFSICSASASSGNYNELKWTLDNNGVLSISGEGAMHGFLSDSTDAWRSYQYDVKKVVIHNGVTNIGMFAFAGCSYLTEVSIPASVTSIDLCAFSECINLNNITIPDTVMTIGSSAFYKCKKLTSIVLPKNLKFIDDHTFGFCEKLAYVRIPETVTKINSGAFSACGKLTMIDLPEGLTEIGQEAFSICYELHYITIPRSLRRIGDYAFYSCNSIQKVFYGGTQTERENIIMGSDYSTFKNAAWFYEVGKSRTVTIPSGAVVIEENALENTAASVYIIPEGVQSIKSNSFSNLVNATKFYLPVSITSIDEDAFSGSDDALFIFPNTSCYAYGWAEQKGFSVVAEQ